MIGAYRILHEVGRGGMGVVYAGMQESDGFKRRVAIKLLKRGMDTEDVLRRFELERQLLATLNHPGIARLYEAGQTDDGLPYFVMEYVEGLTITEYCDLHRLAINERLELFERVCAAVHHAHQNLIVHRDLKPSNIIVTQDGQPKLLDFGIAKVINPEYAMIAGDPTAPEVRVMTPEYASPEQVRGNPISTASDIYSLGVLLYEIVSGHRPYKLRSRGRDEVERVVCTEEPERPSTAISRIEEVPDERGTTSVTLTPESVSRTRDEGRPQRLRRRLSGDIDNIVLMAMRKEPLRRYRSAEQLGEDIRRHRMGMPVIARPDTVGYRVSKFVGRHRMGVATAALFCLSLVAGLTGTASGWGAAKNLAEEATQQRDAAQIERDRAQRRFEEVKALAHTLMYDLHDEVVRLDGSMEARTLLVETAKSYLDGIKADLGADADLRAEQATSLERLGDIQGGTRGPSLGQVDQALVSYKEAAALRRDLVAEDPADRARQRDLASSLLRIGDVMLAKDQVTEALAIYGEELEIAEVIAAAPGATTEDREALEIALLNEGAALNASGDRAGALARYERSLDIRRALSAERPKDLDRRRDVSVALVRVGGRLEDEGLHAEALAKFEEAIRVRTELTEAKPENTRWRRDLAFARYFAADSLLSLDRPAEAVEHLRSFLAITRERFAGNPTSARELRDVALAHEIMGRALAESGDWSAARAEYEAFHEHATMLVDATPGDAESHMLIALADQRMGEAKSALGDAAGAIESGRSAVEKLEALIDGGTGIPASEDVRRRARCAHAHLRLGTWLRAEGQPGDAIAHLERARELYLSLAEGDGIAPADREGMVSTLRELLEALRAGGAGGTSSADRIASIEEELQRYGAE
jgi:non-specific serine/threonine protein kinase/serine/threonine-protein kinase